MRFYSDASLVQDGRRHGVRFLPPCVQCSGEKSRVDADNIVRLGLGPIQGARAKAVEAAVAARKERGFASLADFMRRTEFNPKERRALATAGALNALADHRRAALWRVETMDSSDELFQHALAADEPELSPLEKSGDRRTPINRCFRSERGGRCVPVADFVHASASRMTS